MSGYIYLVLVTFPKEIKHGTVLSGFRCPWLGYQPLLPTCSLHEYLVISPVPGVPRHREDVADELGKQECCAESIASLWCL